MAGHCADAFRDLGHQVEKWIYLRIIRSSDIRKTYVGSPPYTRAAKSIDNFLAEMIAARRWIGAPIWCGRWRKLR